MRRCGGVLVTATMMILCSCGGDASSEASTGATLSGSTSGATTAETSTTNATSQTSASESDSGSTDDSESSGTKFDALDDLDAGAGCGGGGEIAFSHLWVANSAENTVSKIDTQLVQEVGRYRVHPDPSDQNGTGSPSRTSVNLAGDMIVANRCQIKNGPPAGCGGLTKIAARLERCDDRDQNGMITTSQGQDDVLPWFEDECVLWHLPIQTSSNRPVAWTSGDAGEDGCELFNAKIWTAAADPQNYGGAYIHLVDGDAGVIEQTVHIPEFGGDVLAVYGGAVDIDDDFWFVGGNAPRMGHVSMSDFSYELFDMPSTPYGIIVDTEGRPWSAGGSIKRYDPDAGSWAELACPQNACSTLVQGPDGWIWVTEGSRVHKVDPEGVVFEDAIDQLDIPELSAAKGISVDVEGYLWVLQQGTLAYKIDRETYQYWIFSNPSSMYTYSDMTGFGLWNVNNPVG